MWGDHMRRISQAIIAAAAIMFGASNGANASQATFACDTVTTFFSTVTSSCPGFDSGSTNRISAVELQYHGFALAIEGGSTNSFQFNFTTPSVLAFSFPFLVMDLSGPLVGEETVGFGADAPQLFPVPIQEFGLFGIIVSSFGPDADIATAHADISVRYTFDLAPGGGTEIPLPGSLLLFLSGGALVVAAVRRKSRPPLA